VARVQLLNPIFIPFPPIPNASGFGATPARVTRSQDTPKPQPTESQPFRFASDARAASRNQRRASLGDVAGGSGGGGAQGAPQARQRVGSGGGSILDGGFGGSGFGVASTSSQQHHQQQPAQSTRSHSRGHQRLSLTIPQSPLLRTKTRSHSVRFGIGLSLINSCTRCCD